MEKINPRSPVVIFEAVKKKEFLIIFFHVITPLNKDENSRINGKSILKLSNAYVTNNIYSKNVGNMNIYYF